MRILGSTTRDWRLVRIKWYGNARRLKKRRRYSLSLYVNIRRIDLTNLFVTLTDSQHFHPSTHNPNWCTELEDRYRNELTDSQFTHEILAEFGTEEAGVFNKDKLDAAMRMRYYHYDVLTDTQRRGLDPERHVISYLYDEEMKAPPNPFRCVGINFYLCLYGVIHRHIFR